MSLPDMDTLQTRLAQLQQALRVVRTRQMTVAQRALEYSQPTAHDGRQILQQIIKRGLDRSCHFPRQRDKMRLQRRGIDGRYGRSLFDGNAGIYIL